MNIRTDTLMSKDYTVTSDAWVDTTYKNIIKPAVTTLHD